MKAVKEYQVYVNINGCTSHFRKFADRRAARQYLKFLKAEFGVCRQKPWHFGNADYWQIDGSLFKNLVFVEHTKLQLC